MKRKIFIAIALLLATSYANAATVLTGNGIVWTYSIDTTTNEITLMADTTGASFGWDDVGYLAGIGIKGLGGDAIVTSVDLSGDVSTRELNSAGDACQKGGSGGTRGCAYGDGLNRLESDGGPLTIVLGITSTGALVDEGFHFKVRWENEAGTKTGSLISDDFTPVPLPAAAWLFASALIGLTVVARRRRGSSDQAHRLA